MRLMWLWVLLYAIVAGIIMLVTGLFFFLLLGTSEAGHPSVEIVEGIGCVLALLAAMGGFWFLFAGFILLLIRGRFAVGRKISLIGIWVYYAGAFGIVMRSSLIWFVCDFPLECLWTLFYYAIAAVVILPGFFIMRQFRRLEAENSET